MADEVRKVPVQIAHKIAEVSGTDSGRSCGGFRYKNLPKFSKLLGITHEFIWFRLGFRFHYAFLVSARIPGLVSVFFWHPVPSSCPSCG